METQPVKVKLTEVFSPYHFGVYANGELIYCGSYSEGFSLEEFIRKLFEKYPEGAWIVAYDAVGSENMYHSTPLLCAGGFPGKAFRPVGEQQRLTQGGDMDRETALVYLAAEGSWQERLRAAVMAHLRQRRLWLHDPPETLIEACVATVIALAEGNHQAQVNGVSAWRIADAYGLEPLVWAARSVWEERRENRVESPSDR